MRCTTDKALGQGQGFWLSQQRPKGWDEKNQGISTKSQQEFSLGHINSINEPTLAPTPFLSLWPYAYELCKAAPTSLSPRTLLSAHKRPQPHRHQQGNPSQASSKHSPFVSNLSHVQLMWSACRTVYSPVQYNFQQPTPVH